MFSRGRSLAGKFLLLTLAMAVALTGSQAFAQSKPKPIAVVTLTSLNQLLEDVNFIGSLGDQPRLADQIRPFVGMIQGLDADQPIGLIVQADEVSPSGALCVPCKDLKMMLGGMALFGVTQEEVGTDGLIKVGAQGQTVFAKEADGWAYFSMMPDWLESLPPNPGELFGKITSDYDLGVRLHVQNIPEAYKQMALGSIEAGMQSAMQQLEDETDEQFEARKELTNAQIQQIKDAVQELDELTLGIAIDGEQQRVFLDVMYTAVAGSKMADQINANSDPKTDFAGFFQPDAAMMMSFASKIGESEIAQMDQMFSAMMKQVETAIDEEADDASDEEREVIKSAVGDFMSALKATLEAGKMDGGAVLNLSPTSISLVAGGFVADPGKVESGLKKLTKLAAEKESKFPGVNWNASSHKDVQFHTINIPIPDEDADEAEKARQLFGDTIDVAVGIGKDTAYFAAGRDCLEAIKGIMDVSAASPQKSVPPMEMSFALSQILTTVSEMMDDDEDEKQQVEMMAQMLANNANGRDHVRLVAQPVPNGVRMRFELEEGVLRAIGAAAKSAQMQGAGAGGF